MQMLYMAIIFIATTIGAITGLGGGVIIKPSLDFLNFHSVQNISFLSSCAVFSMSLYGVGKHLVQKTPIRKGIIIKVSLGAMIGGFVGTNLFQTAIQMTSKETVASVQSLSLIILLILTIIAMKRDLKTYNIDNTFLTILVGLVLGILSSFLGIGGGPFNVIVFNILYSIDFKKATVYSLATILFAQLTNLMTIGIQEGFGSYDTGFLIFIIPAALIGGIVGTYLNKKMDEKWIKSLFMLVMYALVLLNVINLF